MAPKIDGSALQIAAMRGDPTSQVQSAGFGDPVVMEDVSRLLAQRLAPDAAQKYLMSINNAYLHSSDPGNGPSARAGFQSIQQGMMDPGSTLAGQQAMQQQAAMGQGQGGALGSSFVNGNTTEQDMARQLAKQRDMKDYAFEDQMRNLQLQQAKADLANTPGQGQKMASFGGVQETPQQRRQFLLSLLGAVR